MVGDDGAEAVAGIEAGLPPDDGRHVAHHAAPNGLALRYVPPHFLQAASLFDCRISGQKTGVQSSRRDGN